LRYNGFIARAKNSVHGFLGLKISIYKR